MRVEFCLHDERSGKPELYRAADCNELVEIAEQLGLAKEVKKLGYCGSGSEGEVISYYGTEERRYDEIRIAPHVYLVRAGIGELEKGE